MPATAPLRAYQTEAAAWIVNRLHGPERAVLVADEAGLGKTLEALEAARLLGAKRILIVCPAGARRVWDQEIRRWFPAWSPGVFLVEPGTSADALRRRLLDSKLVLVVGYDTFSDKDNFVAPALSTCLNLGARGWDLLILDECHYLKNLSNRTLAIYGRGGQGFGVQGHTDKVILLSGTPCPNHAGELYQHIRTFWPQILPGNGSLSRFEDYYTRYRDTVFGRQIAGSKNQTKLREALQDVVLRRRKAEVLDELPPLIVQDMPLTLGVDDGRNTRAGLARSYGKYGEANGNVEGEEETDATRKRISATSAGVTHAREVSTGAASSGRHIPDADRAAVELAATLTDDALLRVLRNPDSGVIALRQQLGLAKTPATIEWVHERLLSTDKLLVFGWHHRVIEALSRGLAEYKPAVITGETAPAARAAAIDRFQTDPHTRVFIGQILAAGTAITLTAASEVAIVEPSWVPGDNVQAICRAHRLGQRDSVLASFLYLPGTLDERIMSVFRRKAAEIGQLQGDV